jgi:transcriptional regulator with XRE-family HTH domain
MTTGELIRQKRTEFNMTQEELGQKLDPKVNRAAVNKWETGQVESIKRNHIQQIAKIFDITPCELMCFDDKLDSAYISEEVKTIELVRKHFGKDMVQMIEMVQKLNKNGRTKVLQDLSDLVEHPKFTEN